MRKGFTLIELMIVIAIIAIIAAIAIPNLLESRVTANEASAGASLKSGVFAAEVQFQAGGYQDSDTDNVGEYGTLGALTGVLAPTKGGVASLAVNELRLLTGPLATQANNVTMRSANGFQYRAWSPNTSTTAGGVTGTAWQEGGAAPVAAPALSDGNNGEKFFQCAAAPADYGNSGRRVFVISQDGQVRSPAAVADVNIWWGGAPTVGLSTSQPLLDLGMADSVSVAAFAIGMLDNLAAPGFNSYPVYTK